MKQKPRLTADWIETNEQELAALARRRFPTETPKLLIGVGDEREREWIAGIAARAVSDHCPLITAADDPAVAFSEADDLWAAVVEAAWLADRVTDLFGRVRNANPYALLIGYAQSLIRGPRTLRYCLARTELARRLPRLLAEHFDQLAALPGRWVQEQMGMRVYYAFGPDAVELTRYPMPDLREPPSARQTEHDRIEWALLEARGNQTHAAKLLGIDRARLIRRQASLGIPTPTAEEASARMEALRARTGVNSSGPESGPE